MRLQTSQKQKFQGNYKVNFYSNDFSIQVDLKFCRKSLHAIWDLQK